MIAQDTHAFIFLEEKVMFLSTLKNLETWQKRKQKKFIKTVRSDQGEEYKSGDFTKYCKENGIVQQFTVPSTP